MFFSLILENASGDRVNMTTTANQYMTAKVEGLNPPPCTISTSSYAGVDGSYLNNAFIEKRNVVIHFEMRGVGIEARRHQLYKVVKPSRYIKIYYKTAGIDVFTEGYVETCEVNNFEMFTTGQISILCPDIYWYATETQTAEYSQVLGAFHFICPDDDKPFPIGQYNTENMMTIVNDGDDTDDVFQSVKDELQDALNEQAETISNTQKTSHQHQNQSVLDLLTASTVSNWNKAYSLVSAFEQRITALESELQGVDAILATIVEVRT